MKTTMLYNAKKALTALLLGASSVAMAQTFIAKEDLYYRNWNFFSIPNNYIADSVIWEFGSWNNDHTEWVITTSKIKSFDLQKDGRLTLKAYTRTGLFTKSYNVRYLDPSTGIGSNITNPFTDSLVISINGLELNVPTYLNADSVKWKVRNDLTHDSTTFWHINSDVNTPITVSQNATVTVWVRSESVWYKQLIQFNGITQDPISGVIQAPVIPNATYLWYYEDDILPVSGATYTPTQNGTYKVIITWPTSSNARLADGSNRAEFVFEVTNVIATDLDNASRSSASLTLYPNPASESLHVSNVSGEFEYTIQNAVGNEVASGTALGNSALDISHLNSGLYMVRIKTAGSEVTKKLMVK